MLGSDLLKAIKYILLILILDTRKMGESEATDASKTTLSNETDSNTTENNELVLTFKPFPNTPDLVKAREELTGTKNESLSNAVASHPVDMKDVILENSSKMLKLLFRRKK